MAGKDFYTLPVKFGGLSNTLDISQIPDGYCYRMLNASCERGVLEARGGIKVLGTHEYWDAGDLCYGSGYGKWGETEEWLAVIKLEGDTADAYTVTADGTFQHLTPGLACKRWMFAQFEDCVYGACATGGLVRHKIGDSMSWERLNITFSAVTVAGKASMERPSYGQYAEERSWNDTTESVSGHPSYTQVLWGTIPTPTITAEGQIEFANFTGGNWHRKGYIWAIVTRDGSNVFDFLEKRYFSFDVTVIAADPDDARPSENPTLGCKGNVYTAEPIIYISDDDSASVGSDLGVAWDGWKRLDSEKGLVQVAMGRGEYYGDYVNQTRISVDLDCTIDEPVPPALSTTILDNVQKIAIGIPVRWGNAFNMIIGPLTLGGTFMSKLKHGDDITINPEDKYGTALNDVEYAIQYYDQTSEQETEPVYKTIERALTCGSAANDGLLYMGARSNIKLTQGAGDTAPANYDSIRVWRRRNSDSGKWWLIAEEANADATLVDARVDALYDPIDWYTGTKVYRTDDDFSVGSEQNILKPQCIGVWKTHMCLGVGPRLYMSYASNPAKFLAPSENINDILETNDLTIGRTLYMAQDQSDDVLAIVPQDNLYLAGAKNVYVMIGDSAYDATPPRKLPGSRGALGPTAVCAYADGVLVAAYDGLWYYSASRAFTGATDSAFVAREITCDVKTSWQALVTAHDPAAMVIGSDESGAIFCQLGENFMRCKYPFAERPYWEEGAYDPDELDGSRMLDGPIVEDVKGSGGGGGGDGDGWRDDRVCIPGDPCLEPYACGECGVDDRDIGEGLSCEVCAGVAGPPPLSLYYWQAISPPPPPTEMRAYWEPAIFLQGGYDQTYGGDRWIISPAVKRGCYVYFALGGHDYPNLLGLYAMHVCDFDAWGLEDGAAPGFDGLRGDAYWKAVINHENGPGLINYPHLEAYAWKWILDPSAPPGHVRYTSADFSRLKDYYFSIREDHAYLIDFWSHHLMLYHNFQGDWVNNWTP